MMKKVKVLSTLLLLSLVLVLNSCGPHVSVAPTELTLKVGEVYQVLGVIQENTIATINATMDSWYSSNPEVATVNEEGLVHAISKGECNITATYKQKSASCALTVIEE